MARLSPYTFSQEFDNNGNPLSGGKIYTYEAGTTTPKVTYLDSEGTIPNSNPIILDAAGRYQAWLDSGAYKMVLKTSADVTIDTRDDVAGDTANAFGSSVVVISGNLSVTTVYRNAAIIATASATLSLLPRATAEESFYFAIKNASASGTVTIDPELTETIDGVSTVTLSPGQSCIVIAGAAEWKTLFLPASTQYFSVAQALTTAGIIVKNNSGVNVATFGASGGTNTSLAGNVDVTGTLSAVASLALAGNSTTPAFITLAEDTDNGTNKATIIAPASIASDYTLTLPSSAGTIARTSDIPTVTSWANVTTNPTITNAGAIVTQSYKWRRMGDTIYLRGGFVIASNPASELRIGMPDSLTIDHTKIPIVNSNGGIVGGVFWSGNNAGNLIAITDGTNNYMRVAVQNSASGFSGALNTSAFGIGQTIYIDVAIPVSGW